MNILLGVGQGGWNPLLSAHFHFLLLINTKDINRAPEPLFEIKSGGGVKSPLCRGQQSRPNPVLKGGSATTYPNHIPNWYCENQVINRRREKGYF
jgi:hypothetical protein